MLLPPNSQFLGNYTLSFGLSRFPVQLAGMVLAELPKINPAPANVMGRPL